MKKGYLSLFSFGLLAASLLTPGGIRAEIVTSVPAGGTVKLYERSGEAYYGYRSNTKAFSGLLTEIVEYPDGTVYWKNPVSQAGTATDFVKGAADAYIKGSISGDEMTFQLPQEIAAGTGWGDKAITVTCQMLEVESGFFPAGIPAADQTCVFRKTDGNWVLQNTSKTLVLGANGNYSGDSTLDYGDYNVVLKPSAQTVEDPVAFPAGAAAEKWALISGGAGYFVDVCIDGSDIYVGGIFPGMPDAVVKGTVKDGVCTFASGQYLGLLSAGKTYFTAALYERYTDEATDRTYWRYAFKPSLQFSYDAAEKTLVTRDGLQFVATTDLSADAERYPLSSAAVERIAWQPAEIDNTPGTPALVEYVPYSAKDEEGSLRFSLPQLNDNNQLMDAANMYYRVLVDDHVLELKAGTNGQYYGIKNGMTITEIPYKMPFSTDITSFGSISGIFGSGAEREVTFYISDFTFLGVQAIFKAPGSDPVYSGILSVNGAEIPDAWNPEEDQEPILTAPEGRVEHFSRSGISWKKNLTKGFEKIEYSDMVSDLVFTENGEVYLKHPISQASGNDCNPDTYIKGTYTDDTMTFTFPQVIGKGEMFNYQYDPANVYTTWCQLYTATVAPAKREGYFDVTAVPSDVKTLVFKKDADGSWKAENTSETFFLGASGNYYNKENWINFGDWNITFAPAREIPDVTVIPDGVETEKWAMKYSKVGRMVDVAFDGGDVYLRGISSSLPEAVVKGTVADGRISIAAPAFLNVDSDGKLLYAFAVEQKEFADDEKEIYYTYYTALPELSFAYDKEAKAISFEGLLMVASDPAAEQIRAYNELYTNPVIAWQPAEVGTKPAALLLKKFTPWNDKDKEATIEFDMSAYNAEGQLLDVSKLYYNLIVDGEVFEIPSVYSGGTTYPAIKEIPFAFTNGLTVMATGASHILCLEDLKAPEIVQLRSYYKESEDAEPVYSDMLLVYTSVEMPAVPEIKINGLPLAGDEFMFDEGVAVEVSFVASHEGESVWYAFAQDGETAPEAVKYTDPISISQAGTITFYAENDKYGFRSESKTVTFKLNKAIAIDGIEAAGTDAEYFDLQGRRINGVPEGGIYLQKLNGKVRKVVIR